MIRGQSGIRGTICGKMQVGVLQGAHGEERRNVILLDDSEMSPGLF